MMLVLFDVDKTLFLNSDPLMGQATTDAIETVWGLNARRCHSRRESPGPDGDLHRP